MVKVKLKKENLKKPFKIRFVQLLGFKSIIRPFLFV